jgi:hypothetical protein
MSIKSISTFMSTLVMWLSSLFVFASTPVFAETPMALQVLGPYESPSLQNSNPYFQTTDAAFYEVRLKEASYISFKIVQVQVDGCKVSEISHSFSVQTLDESGLLLEDIVTVSVKPEQSLKAFRYFRTRVQYVPQMPPACKNLKVNFAVTAEKYVPFGMSYDGTAMMGYATTSLNSTIPVKFEVTDEMANLVKTNRMNYRAAYNSYDKLWQISANFVEKNQFGNGFAKLSFSTDAEISVKGNQIIARCFDDEERFLVIGEVTESSLIIDKNVSIKCKPMEEKLFITRDSSTGDLSVTVKGTVNGLKLVGKALLINPL